jgi:hypothetical protein
MNLFVTEDIEHKCKTDKVIQQRYLCSLQINVGKMADEFDTELMIPFSDD